MGKQSARLYFQGKDHKDIFFKNHYHCAMYKGSNLVWQKIIGDNLFFENHYGTGFMENCFDYKEKYKINGAKYIVMVDGVLFKIGSEKNKNGLYSLYYSVGGMGWKVCCENTLFGSIYGGQVQEHKGVLYQLVKDDSVYKVAMYSCKKNEYKEIVAGDGDNTKLITVNSGTSDLFAYCDVDTRKTCWLIGWDESYKAVISGKDIYMGYPPFVTRSGALFSMRNKIYFIKETTNSVSKNIEETVIMLCSLDKNGKETKVGEMSKESGDNIYTAYLIDYRSVTVRRLDDLIFSYNGPEVCKGKWFYLSEDETTFKVSNEIDTFLVNAYKDGKKLDSHIKYSEHGGHLYHNYTEKGVNKYDAYIEQNDYLIGTDGKQHKGYMFVRDYYESDRNCCIIK